jgi:hypothetical protein
MHAEAKLLHAGEEGVSKQSRRSELPYCVVIDLVRTRHSERIGPTERWQKSFRRRACGTGTVPYSEFVNQISTLALPVVGKR